MSVIKILPEYISNRIAAGEVVVRPASVVKELVENSLDAGARKITVNIEQGGEKLIAVIDDGAGMDADDLLLCLEQHATSKIDRAEDIDNLTSFGFRGEALPSIAAVSRLTIRSRRHESGEGNEVNVHGGKFVNTAPVGMAPGTEMIVSNLFFNTPARKKFLKTQATEEKHIIEAVFMLSLPYPEVAFELIIDKKQVYSSPAHKSLLPRIKSYLGAAVSEAFMPLSFADYGIRITGFIARHGLTKTTRREQRVFVNGRGVDSPAIYRGIRSGYGTLLEKGRFPPVILFVAVDPAQVDVNVHPQKREIRFRREGQLVKVVTAAVSQVLKVNSAVNPTIDKSFSLDQIFMGAEVRYENAPEQQDLAIGFGVQSAAASEPEVNSYSEAAAAETSDAAFGSRKERSRYLAEAAAVYDAEPAADRLKVAAVPAAVAERAQAESSAAHPALPVNAYSKEFFASLRVLGFVLDT